MSPARVRWPQEDTEKPAGFLISAAACQPVTRRILIVDDDEMIRHLMRLLLSDLEGGLACEEAANGLDALDRLLADAGRYSLVLLNYMMPGLDGIAVLRELRQAGRSLPPVVLHSAHTEARVRQRAADLGACAFLEMPFEPRHLCQLVRMLLRS